MELTYSAQTRDFDPDKRYRNPVYFEKPESGVTKVTVIGDWPVVVLPTGPPRFKWKLSKPVAQWKQIRPKWEWRI